MVAQPAADDVSGVVHVVLDAATPGERGEQHGAALRLPIQTALRNFKSWVRVQDDAGHTSLGISPFCAGPMNGDYLLDHGVAEFIDGLTRPSLLDVTGLNWIDLGAPPPDGPPPMM